MYIEAYTLGRDSGSIVLSEDISERIGTIYGTFDFEYTTVNEPVWQSIDGYHESEIDRFVVDEIIVTSVQYTDEFGSRAAYAFDAEDVEREIASIINGELDN